MKTELQTFCRSGEMAVERENGYDPKTHLSYDDIAVGDDKFPKVIFLLY